MRLPRRITDIQPPIIPILGELIRATPGTISLGQGVVSYGPPAEALEALKQFGATPADHRYGPVEGDPALIEVIAAKLREENRIDLTGRRVVVTAGGNMAFLNAVLAVTDPGDEVILPVPFYFNHDMAVTMAGCRAVAVPTDEAHQLDVDAIASAITPRTRAVVTVSPNNPSGAVYPADVLRAVNELCARHGLVHISDEAYEYFLYGEATHYSPASSPDSVAHTISLYSLSKAYGMASWRMGYMVVPESLADAVSKVQDTNLICPPLVSQRVAAAALRVGRRYWEPYVAELGQVRDDVQQALTAVAGIVDAPPTQGAFYTLLRIRGGGDPFALVQELVRTYRVAAVPGTAFGLTDGCYLRVSFGALERGTVVEGIGRLVTALRALGSGLDSARMGSGLASQ
jgi:aspartate/methionine/tyrosine aminotransferase